MDANLSEVEDAILKLYYEPGTNALQETEICRHLSFSISEIKRAIHELDRHMMISGVHEVGDPGTTAYRLTDRGKKYLEEKYEIKA